MDTVFGRLRFKRRTAALMPALDIGEPGFLVDTNQAVIGTAGGNVPIGNTFTLPARLDDINELSLSGQALLGFDLTGDALTFPVSNPAVDLLDESSFSNMVNKLGGAPSSGAGGLLRETSPRIQTDIAPAVNGLADLGAPLLRFKRLYLDTGAVINWSNGGMTATYSTGLLTFSGSVTVAGTVTSLNANLTNVTIATKLEPLISGAIPIGSAAFPFSGLYLASAGFLNIGNGNWVATHSTGVVTIGTGDLRITTPGVNAASVPTLESTSTFKNKRITKRTATAASSATPTINTDTTDHYLLTALAVAVTSFTTNLTGSPVEGDTLRVSITDNGTSRAINWGAKFEASGIPLPASTTPSVRLDCDFVWNGVTSKWRVIDSTVPRLFSDAGTLAAGKLLAPDASIGHVRLAGYYSAGDGGGALYKRVGSMPGHLGRFQTADGAWWELAEKVPNIRMFGAYGDGTVHQVQEWITAGIFANLAAVQAVYTWVGATTDSLDGVALKAAVSMLLGTGFDGGDLYVAAGTYKLNVQVVIPKASGKLIKLRGAGRATIFDIQAMTGTAGIYSGSASAAEYGSCDFFDLTFRGITQASGRAISLENANGARFERCYFLLHFLAVAMHDCFSVHFMGCVWINIGSHGIISDTAAHNLTVTDGCAMFDVGVNQTGRCIALAVASDNVSIHDCDFESCRQVLQMNGGSALTVVGNYIEFCTVAFFDFYGDLYGASICQNWLSLGAATDLTHLIDSEFRRNSLFNQVVTWNANSIRCEAVNNRLTGTSTMGSPGFGSQSNNPAISATSGAFTTASATLYWWTFGRFTYWSLKITITNAGTAAGGINVPLPFNPSVDSAGYGRETQATGSALSIQGLTGAASLVIFRFDNATIIASGRTIVANGFCIVG